MRAFSAVICTLTVMLTALILCFYILVVCGASERLQNIWVWFRDAHVLSQVSGDHVHPGGNDQPDHRGEYRGRFGARFHHPQLRREETETVETEPAETDTDKVETEPAETEPPETTPAYEEEGYSLLEEGLYLKEVSGSGWRGYVMLVEDRCASSSSIRPSSIPAVRT